jgi:hypothetical protein
MGNDVNQSPGTSPSKAINDNSKNSWIGGTPAGITDPKKALADSPTKHPLPAPHAGEMGPAKK